ncbi:MAG TPA: BTAD domain-containing putative transcriptional regulator [Acidimicrobiales bacterium]|nr:BTAD domain-containing putative transcriptional regulator [Acidimicrobiales bacterium]
MRFRVLGAVELVDPNGGVVAVGSPNQRRILAVLLARIGEAVPVDTLAEAVWGDDLPESAVATLRTYVSRLRAVLGDSLVSRGAGYALVAAPDDVDAGRFESLMRDAATADAAEAVTFLDEALRLWRGSAFAEHADVACIAPEARRLEELRRSASESRARALLRAGRVDESVAAAEALATAEPLREGAWTQLIEGLAAQGRTADALRAFQRAGDALAEAGLEPSDALRESERMVLAGEAAPPVAERVTAAAPRPDPRAPPTPASSFVGRDHECAHLVGLLDKTRIVTLVGPGGVGKTRLAIEAARVAASRRSLGARLVELAEIRDAVGVADAVVAALGLTAEGEAPLAVLDRAGVLDVLLVLDNAEHVLDAAADVVARAAGRGDALRVLTTSRERLGVDGEHVRPVAPLATDTSGAPARRLLVQRAATVAPDLTVEIDDERVARVVTRLDGLPLAIEMAAAELSTMSLADLDAELGQSLAQLRSPHRHASERQRTLAGVLAWSEARLDDDERATLAGLSVFAGSFRPDDAVAVLGSPGVATTLRSLVDRSLVRIDRTGPGTRYALLQTVHDFASGRLASNGREPDLARRHALRFLEVAEHADRQLRTAEEATGLAQIEAAFADIRVAHRWARGHNPALAGRLSAALHLYAYRGLIDEPLRWAELTIQLVPDDDPTRPVLLASAATRAINRGDLEEARAIAQRAVALAGSGPAAMPALEALGDACLYLGRLDESRAAAEELARRAEAVGDMHSHVLGRVNAALAPRYGGQAIGPEAIADLPARLSDLSPTSRAWIAYTNGELIGDRAPDTALAHYQEAIRLARSVDSRFAEGVALVSACALQARAGDVPGALAQFAEVIDHWAKLADNTHQLTTLRNLAVLLQRAGAPQAAAELLGALERDDSTYGEEAERLEAVREWARAQLGDDVFATHVASGRERDVTAAAAWALDVLADLRR